MTKILVTGSNSFIGNNFIKNSKYSEIDKISLVNNKPEDVDFSKYDVVLHLAAIVHAKKKQPKQRYFEINTNLCLSIAEKAKQTGVKQFIFISTIRVYGKYEKEKGPWNEDSPCFPDDYYGMSKYQAEIELRKLEDKNFTVSIIRPPLVYGEDAPANMLSLIKLVERFPVLPFKSVKNSRHFVSVENLTMFIEKIILLRATGIFIACDQRPLSTTELVSLIAKHLNKNPHLVRIPDVIIKIGLFLIPKYFERLYCSFKIDNKKTLEVLKIEPVFLVEESIMKMVLKYQEKKKIKSLY